MNKPQLIQSLEDRCSLSTKDASEIVDIFFSEMSNTLAKGDRIDIRGLWTFYVKEYEGYIGRNPKTGEKVQVPAKKLPFFKCGKELKERVDYRAN